MIGTRDSFNFPANPKKVRFSCGRQIFQPNGESREVAECRTAMTRRRGRTIRLALLLALPGFLSACPAAVAEHDRACPSKTLFEDVTLDASSPSGQLGVLEGVTEVVGDVVLTDYPGDLEAMSCLEKVHGALRLGGDSLGSLRGLDRLRETGELSISLAPGLGSLAGLESLETTGLLSLSELPELDSTAALESLESINGELWLSELPSVVDWSGFTGVSGISDRLFIRDVNSNGALELDLGEEFAGEILVDIRSPDLRVATSSLVRVDGTLASGTGTAVLFDLSRLEHVGGGLHFSTMEPAELPALPSLRSVTGALELRGMDMSDLAALSRLETVGALQICDSDTLQTLAGLENLRSLVRIIGDGGAGQYAATGTLDICNNPVLTDVSALAGLTDFGNQGPSFLWIANNPSLSNLSGLAPAASQMLLASFEDLPALTNLAGLSNLTGLGELAITNTGVRTLDGFSLEPGASISGSFQIVLEHNAELADISALLPATDRALPSGGYIVIEGQPQLSQCQAEAFVQEAREAGFDGTVELSGLLADGPC